MKSLIKYNIATTCRQKDKEDRYQYKMKNAIILMFKEPIKKNILFCTFVSKDTTLLFRN